MVFECTGVTLILFDLFNKLVVSKEIEETYACLYLVNWLPARKLRKLMHVYPYEIY